MYCIGVNCSADQCLKNCGGGGEEVSVTCGKDDFWCHHYCDHNYDRRANWLFGIIFGIMSGIMSGIIIAKFKVA